MAHVVQEAALQPPRPVCAEFLHNLPANLRVVDESESHCALPRRRVQGERIQMAELFFPQLITHPFEVFQVFLRLGPHGGP